MNPIYFAKVEFVENVWGINEKRIIILNLVSKELLYQVINLNRQMPAIQGIESFIFGGRLVNDDVAYPARMIKNEKTDFRYRLIQSEAFEERVLFSYGIKLTDEQIQKLLPYCNALEYEVYRDKKMSMMDEGYIGYRDEVNLKFAAVTDSYIPRIELPMNYYYDEEHIWPSEKLYRYLVKTFFADKKKLKGWGPTYGGHSLFFCC